MTLAGMDGRNKGGGLGRGAAPPHLQTKYLHNPPLLNHYFGRYTEGEKPQQQQWS